MEDSTMIDEIGIEEVYPPEWEGWTDEELDDMRRDFDRDRHKWEYV